LQTKGTELPNVSQISNYRFETKRLKSQYYLILEVFSPPDLFNLCGYCFTSKILKKFVLMSGEAFEMRFCGENQGQCQILSLQDKVVF
jgi:hypothetical protein